MDPRVLTLLALLLAVRPAMTDSLAVPARDGSASGALRAAQERGRFDVPWTVSAELDGQAEEWIPWTGLPLRQNLVAIGGGDRDMSGSAGAPGPLGAHAVSDEALPGFGGLEERALLPFPLAQDTPVTTVHFWRGAVNSYRFGFGLARNVVGPWNLDMRMSARSAPGRSWEYRQQVNDMFGPRGKPQGLPYQGRGPGQDDTRWEFTGSRSLPGGRLDLGWNWVDDQRGVPDPYSTWDSVRSAHDAWTSRSALFARLELERGGWSILAGGRRESGSWKLPAWKDTGWWADAEGSSTVQSGSARIGIGPRETRLFLEGFLEGVDGSATIPSMDSSADPDPTERRGRLGASARGDFGLFTLGAGGGWNALEPSSGGAVSAFDGSASLRLGTDSVYVRAAWSRSALLPGFSELGKPDVFRPRLDTHGLAPEIRDRGEFRLRWASSFLSAEAACALLAVRDAIRPAVLPSRDAPVLVERGLALRPRNRDETVLGFSTDAGVRAQWRWFEASSRLGFGRTGLPGEPLGGDADLSEPQWRTRSSLRWSAELLPGRFLASTGLALNTWSDSWIYVPSGKDQAALLELPASWGLDFEARCEIRTFEIFWRMENLGHQKQYVLPGWTPLGLRAGWGVVWSFGG